MRLKRVLLSVLGSIGLVTLLALPFGFKTFELGNFYLKNIFSAGSAITANATNFWGIFYYPNKFISDGVFFGPFKAAILGSGIFVLIYCFVLVFWWKQRDFTKLVFPAATLITYAAFLFLPRMHERYLFPVIFPLLIWAVQSRSKFLYLGYWLVSFLFLINLYVVAPLGLPFLEGLVKLYWQRAWYFPTILGLSHLVIFSYLGWVFFRFTR